MEVYTLILDDNLLEEYNEYYFKKHPRARKVPIPKPRHPSMNEWMILRRTQMNALKQRWKEFGVWWINKLGYQDKKLENFEVEETVYMDSRRRADADNFTAKFLHDSFTESGFIIDDDYKHFRKLTMMVDYDKEWPRTEIKVINYDC